MAKRIYPNREYYEQLFNEYIAAHGESLIKAVLQRLKFNSVEELQQEEYHGSLQGDCGCTYITPVSKEQAREWRLDDGINSRMYIHFPNYNTQSITIKEIMANQMLKDLDLSEAFSVNSILD